MILTKEIKVELNQFNYHHYKRLGYDTDNKSFLMVKIEDVGIKSVVKVDTKCDICFNIKNISYSKYNKNISSGGFYACSNKCAVGKGEKTCLEKYGTKYALQNEDIKLKTKSYFIEKFGVDNPSKSKEVRDKRENTMMERFGVKTNIILPETHKKAIEISMSDESKTKRENTNMKRYSVENVFESEIIRNKTKITNLERYGVEYPSQNIDIFNKTQITQLKVKYYKNIRYQGTYELDFLIYCDKLNILHKIKKIKSVKYILDNKEKVYHPDFYIEELNLIIEIKSDYYYYLHLDKNNAKEISCIKKGYNFLFIINKDYTILNEKIKAFI